MGKRKVKKSKAERRAEKLAQITELKPADVGRIDLMCEFLCEISGRLTAIARDTWPGAWDDAPLAKSIRRLDKAIASLEKICETHRPIVSTED